MKSGLGAMAVFQLLSFGLIVHIIFLFAVFDIYFKSTVIIGISPINNTIPPVGKRVVVISADGLRADSLCDKETGEVKDTMPFMKSVMEEKGTWGISESHVPTESRPGHVAMLAGFYEDPSAITKGWKENPVTFDSVFNRSVCSFSWGSPDILNIFLKGLDRNCTHAYSYENEQNFAGDTMEYDNWVYREFKSFLQNSKSNQILYGKGLLFFLHLLGQDTSGHTHKPHTEKYMDNLKNVDKIVKEVETLVNDFYKDNLTSFVFTSDHGMTDWGSHGAGHPNETNTPIVAWGAGINKPVTTPNMVNISQADITPMLAVLLGSPIPVNSVGQLPLEYLNISEQYKSQAMLMNAKQITKQFQINLENVKAKIMSLFHTPFEKLTNEELENMIGSITEQIKHQQYEDAIQKSKILMEIGLEGLEYYQNYYQRPLLISVSSSCILWIIYLVLELFDGIRSCHSQIEAKLSSQVVFGISSAISIILVLIQRLPFSFTFYFLLPQFLLYLCIRKFRKCHLIMLKKNAPSVILWSIILGIGVEVIVASFFKRYILCLSLIFTLALSFISADLRDKTIALLWFISGVILSGFCVLPIVGGQPNIALLIASGIILCVFLFVVHLLDVIRENVFLYGIRSLAVAAAVWNSVVVHANFSEGGLPEFNQVLSWGLCGFALLLLLLGKPHILDRFDKIFISLLVPFQLLSIGHEGLFVMFLFVHLRCWIFFEVENCESLHLEKEKLKWRYPSTTDFRRAYLFLLYVWVGFFGLGNIASLNSFDTAWVRCFLTVFSPYVMVSLILFKTIIPFLIVTCSMRALTVILKLRPDQLFIIVLIYCNVMGLNFLYMVQNKGSWFDIGSSISHYVIQQVAVLFLLTLYGVAKFLLSFSFRIFPESRGDVQFVADLFNSQESLTSLPQYHPYYKLHRS